MSYNSLEDNLTPLSELAKSIGINPNKKDFDPNNYIPVDLIPLKQLYVDKKFQRLLNKTMIRKAKYFDPVLCRPLFVYRRPDGKYSVVDGQHTATLAYLYNNNSENVLIPCQVRAHSTANSVDDCVVEESNIFKKLNTNRTNVSQVEKLRAEIAAGDEEALAIEEKLKDLGVHIEQIGDPEGNEVYGYAKLMESVSKYKTDCTRSAILHYESLVASDETPKWDKPMQGAMIGGLAAIFHLIKTELGVGAKANGLLEYLNKFMCKTTPKEFMEGTAGNASSILIARRIVNKYNDGVDFGVIDAPKIGEKVLENAGLGGLDVI